MENGKLSGGIDKSENNPIATNQNKKIKRGRAKSPFFK